MNRRRTRSASRLWRGEAPGAPAAEPAKRRRSIMLLLAQLCVFLIALGGVVTGSLGAIYFAGGAMNRAAGTELRRQRAVLAALCVCGIVASAALGFVAIPALMYLASR